MNEMHKMIINNISKLKASVESDTLRRKCRSCGTYIKADDGTTIKQAIQKYCSDNNLKVCTNKKLSPDAKITWSESFVKCVTCGCNDGIVASIGTFVNNT